VRYSLVGWACAPSHCLRSLLTLHFGCRECLTFMSRPPSPTVLGLHDSERDKMVVNSTPSDSPVLMEASSSPQDILTLYYGRPRTTGSV